MGGVGVGEGIKGDVTVVVMIGGDEFKEEEVVVGVGRIGGELGRRSIVNSLSEYSRIDNCCCRPLLSAAIIIPLPLSNEEDLIAAYIQFSIELFSLQEIKNEIVILLQFAAVGSS